LKNKNVFITGGGSGIGAAISEGFLQQGANVAFVQRTDANLFCNDMLQKYGRRPLYIECDVTNISALNSAIDDARDFYGEIDILINNAANDIRHETLQVTENFWNDILAINLKAYFFSIKKVIEPMKLKRMGTIVNFTSISYMMGNTGYPLYVTANSGLNGMTRSLAREFGEFGVRVNALAPGWVLTEKQLKMWAKADLVKKHIEKQCIKKAISPEDIVDPTLFLSSNSSNMITGQTLVVDGGVVTTG